MLAVESLAWEILTACANPCQVATDTAAPRWLRDARDLLDIRAHEPLSLRRLAREAGVHPVHFAATFRRFHRMSVGEFVRRRRLEYAREKLDDQTLTMAEIAHDAGYATLDAASQAILAGERFRIATASNRVGIRLEGPALALRAPLELVSAAVTHGTLQLPPGGQPIMLAAEHPTTGGYPRIAHLIDADRAALAQCCPGDTIRLRLIDADEAERVRRRRAAALARLEEQVRQRRRESGCHEST